MRSMVEGLALHQNGFEHCGQICQNFPCRYSQRYKALLCQPHISRFVVSGLSAQIVPFAVDLDCQSSLKACEIENEWASGMLAPEFEAARSLSQFTPKQSLRQRELSSKLTGLANG